MTTLLDCTAVLPEILLLVDYSDHAGGLPVVCKDFAAAWDTPRWLRRQPHAAYHSLCTAAKQGREDDACRLLAIVREATSTQAAGLQVWRSACADAAHHAANPSTTAALLAAGAEPQTLPGYSSALTAAARHGNAAAVAALLGAGLAVMRGHPAVQAAVEEGHVSILSALLEACSGKLHARTLNPDWLSWLLVCAAKCGQAECIPLLVAAGANQPDHFARALRIAAAFGRAEQCAGVVAALVAAGADVGAVGADALHEAAVRQHREVARQLVAAGACARAQWVAAWCLQVAA